MSIFKKLFLLFCVGYFVSMPLLFVQAATEATVDFTPSEVSFVEGDLVDVALYVDPHGTRDYTAVLMLEYPASLVSVRNFKQADGWVPIAPEGYDTLDNDGGLLKKTAGYPRGITERTLFGTITFFAKKAGTGSTTVLGGLDRSLVLDKDGGNVLDLSNTPTLTMTIVQAPVPEPDLPEESADAVVEESLPDDTPTPVASPQIEEEPQLSAAAVNAFPVNTSGKVAISIVLFLMLIGAYIFIWKTPSKKRR